MHKIVGLVLTLVLVVAGSAVPASASADVTLLAKSDKRGDVKLLKSKKISKAKKKSIDIDRAAVVLLGNGKFRYKVRLKKLHRSKKWDQMVFFISEDPRRTQYGYPVVNTSVSFKVRNSGGASGYDSVSGDVCSLKVKRKGRSVWVDVPEKCAPNEGDRVRVATATGHYQTDERPYSKDSLRLGSISYPEPE